MSKILIIDLEEALFQFTPAIWGLSDLNENQAERLAKKLVRLLEQNCRVKRVTRFEGVVSSHIDHAKSTTGQDIRLHGRCILLDNVFDVGEPVKVLVIKENQ